MVAAFSHVPPSPPGSFHLLGIGGAGMSGLARVLLQLGFRVSGSDLVNSQELQRLSELGARIFIGHRHEQIGDAGTLVVTPAVPADNPEVQEAKRRGLRILNRAEMLAELLSERKAICVAGSHGKTSTSAMMATLLRSSGEDPTFFIGAEIPSLGGKARIGRSDLAVVEACEAFGALSALKPEIAIITNITDEHLEHYGSIAALRQAFVDFLSRLPESSFAMVCGDDPSLLELFEPVGRRILSYGFAPHNRLIPGIEESGPSGTSFCLEEDGRPIGRMSLPIPGLHQVLNATACIGCALELGLSFEEAAAGLETFRGSRLRWELRSKSRGVGIIEDFAHHPVEIEATLRTGRDGLDEGGHLIAVFQPQLYSRTRRLFRDFARVLSRADLVALMETDGGGEAEDSRVSSQLIAHELNFLGHPPLTADTPGNLSEALLPHLRSADTVVVMGAGRGARTFGDLLSDALRKPADESLGEKAGGGWVLARIEEYRRRSPDSIAVETPERCLSYAALAEEAERLAARMLKAGLRPGETVALCLGRSIEAIVAWLAVLKAGGVVLPLDPNHPDRRLTFMLEDSNAALLLSTKALAHRKGLEGPPLLLLDHDDGVSGPPPTEWTRWPALGTRDPAYTIYTSGSTGLPKGVRISHQALDGAALNFSRVFEVDPESRVLQNTSLSFDVSVAEIFMTLSAGARLSIAEKGGEDVIHPTLGRRLREHSITHLAITPSALSRLAPEDFPCLSHIIVAGEPCPPELVEVWAPGRKLFNAYGPTEATIYATFSRCRIGEKVSIGRPIGRTRTGILDEAGHSVPVGKAGELILGGPAVALGYLNRPDLNLERFLPDPLGTSPDDRLYRTGDLVRLARNGHLEFLGRMDEQLKIAGNRIEPGEIESLLKRHPAISDAVVISHPRHHSSLMGCIVPADGQAPTGRSLRDYLAQDLPSYMLPSEWKTLETIPLTPAGKVDRAVLAGDRGLNCCPVVDAESMNALEKRLAPIWREVLMLDRNPGLKEDFFDLGGGSLLAARLIEEVERGIGIEIPLHSLNRLGTIAEMAALISAGPKKTESGEKTADATAADQLRRKLLALNTGWNHERPGADSLLVTVHRQSGKKLLIWCAQLFWELEILGRHLGPVCSFHGMLSGQKIMDSNEENLDLISRLYGEEILFRSPEGPLVLGGNCQGAAIARRIGAFLKARGRKVSRLILMETARFPPCQIPVTFLFGESSFLNPHRRFSDPENLIRSTCTADWRIRMIPGEHGHFFEDPNIAALAATIEGEIEVTFSCADSVRP